MIFRGPLVSFTSNSLNSPPPTSMQLYIKAPSLSDSLLSITFNGNSLPALKHAIKESLKPTFHALPLSNLSLRVGSSVIGEEALVDRELIDVLEEAQVSLMNPILVIPLMPYVDKCIYLLLFELGAFFGPFFAFFEPFFEAFGSLILGPFAWGMLGSSSHSPMAMDENIHINLFGILLLALALLQFGCFVLILLFLFRLSPPRMAWFYIFLAGALADYLVDTARRNI